MTVPLSRNQFIKLRTIGYGTSGRALLVKKIEENSETEELYVLKEIRLHQLVTAREKQLARREVQVLAALQHPHIIAYRGSFEERGCLCIIMEYANGGDLHAYLKKLQQQNRHMSETQVLDILMQLTMALKYIHERLLLHRDIKTRNTFLHCSEHDLGQLTVKLGDFGIARVLDSTAAQAHTAIGTPYYLSPEICDSKPYDAKSDMWSLGCVLYEMMTGKHPFEADNLRGLIVKILRGIYPPIPDSLDYSKEVRGLVSMLLEPLPSRRPSAEALLSTPILQARARLYTCQLRERQRVLQTALEHEKSISDSLFRYTQDDIIQTRFLVSSCQYLKMETEFSTPLRAHERLECVRVWLEQRLGLETLLHAYQFLSEKYQKAMIPPGQVWYVPMDLWQIWIHAFMWDREWLPYAQMILHLLHCELYHCQ